jgi:hypothetical protein
MYCKVCGKQMPNDSAFCNHCGAAQGSASHEAREEVQWENCTIDVEHLKVGWWSKNPVESQYVARAMGPSGPFVAGKSAVYATDDEQQRDQAFDFLCCHLVADGWESLPSMYPGTIYRRRVKQ